MFLSRQSSRWAASLPAVGGEASTESGSSAVLKDACKSFCVLCQKHRRIYSQIISSHPTSSPTSGVSDQPLTMDEQDTAASRLCQRQQNRQQVGGTSVSPASAATAAALAPALLTLDPFTIRARKKSDRYLNSGVNGAKRYTLSHATAYRARWTWSSRRKETRESIFALLKCS